MSEKSSVMSLLLKFARKNSHATCHETGEMGIFRFFLPFFYFYWFETINAFPILPFFRHVYLQSHWLWDITHIHGVREREKYK